MIKHVAKYGRVWKRLKDGTILGRELVLKDGEKISGYVEIYKPKEVAKKERLTNKTPFGATGV